MIKCFLVLCVIGAPTVCRPPEEIAPDDGHQVASVMECGRGGFTAYTQRSPDPTKLEWFPKVYGKEIDTGTNEIAQWLEDQKAKEEKLEPQIR